MAQTGLTLARPRAADSSPRSPSLALMLLVLLALWVPSYLLIRYEGRWIEHDTAQFIDTSLAVQHDGRLLPDGHRYPHGYGTQTIATFVSNVTGVPIQQLFTVVFPFLTPIIAISVYALYSQVLGDRRVAVLAALLFMLLPDVTFVLMRGSHEKFSLLCTAIAVLLMAKGLSLLTSGARSLATYSSLVILFYMIVFALLALNHFFASVFIFGLITSLLIGWLIRSREQLRTPALSRHISQLNYAVSTGIVLLFTSMIYLYPPAQELIRLLPDTYNRIATLFLEVEVSANPYNPITTGWRNFPTYLAVNALTWILLPLALVGWLRQAWLIFVRKEPQRPQLLLLWLFCLGFGLQAVLSIVADLSGTLGLNLQLRLFSKFALVAAPFAALFLIEMSDKVRYSSWAGSLVRVVVTAALAWFAVAAVFKGMLEPAISNKWIFYTEREQAILLWIDSNASYLDIWADYDERLREAALIVNAEQSPGSTNNIWAGQFNDGPTRSYAILSDAIRKHSAALRQPLPDVQEWQVLYDNGEAQLYYRPPATPYQR